MNCFDIFKYGMNLKLEIIVPWIENKGPFYSCFPESFVDRVLLSFVHNQQYERFISPHVESKWSTTKIMTQQKYQNNYTNLVVFYSGT